MPNYGVSEYPNTFKRQANFPLDQSSVFYSYTEAEEYAKSNPIAYNGQIIAVSTDDSIGVYVLYPSTKSGYSFDLLELNGTTSYGNWYVDTSEGTNVTLNTDLMLPIEADKYKVLVDNEVEIDSTELTEDIQLPLTNIQNNNIKVVFQKTTDTTTLDILTLELIKTCEFSNTIIGVLKIVTEDI